MTFWFFVALLALVFIFAVKTLRSAIADDKRRKLGKVRSRPQAGPNRAR